MSESEAATLPEIVVEAEQQKQAPPTKKKSASQGGSQTGGAAPAAPNNAPEAETAWSNVDGFVATRSAAATKSDASILETPQSISVITADQMQTRDVKTIVEAVQYSAGVNTHLSGKDPRFDQFQIRGFNVHGEGSFRDGLKELGSSSYFSHFRDETYGIERIDLIRGPASVLYGQTAPGGIINIVTKRPTEERLREFVGTIGTDERFQGAFDFSGKADAEGKLLFRLTGLARDADAQVAHFSDYVEDNRLFIAPAVTFKPDDKTTLTILTEYQHDLTGNAFAASRFYPTLPLGGVTPDYSKATKFFTGDPNYDQFEQDQFRIGYLFEHRFNDMFTVRQNLRYGEVDVDYRYLLGGIAADDVTEFRASRRIVEHLRSFGVDNQLITKLATDEINHTIVAGVDYQYSRLDDVSTGGAPDPNYFLDLTNPVYGQNIPLPTMIGSSTDQKSRQTGVYLQDQAKLDNWVLTLGGRYDWAEIDTLNRVTSDRVVQKDRAFSGRAGLTYLFDFGLAPYVSYSESFLPTTGTNYAGDPFDPTTSQQYEVGIKYEFGRELRATLAAFDITQQNLLTLDSDHSGLGYPCDNACQRQTGEVRSRGFEAEIVATLTEGLSLTAAYTIMDVEVTKTEDPGELGMTPIVTPEELASIYADYTFQSGPLAGFGLGFGARYIGESFQDTTNKYKNPSYTVFDGGLHYDFDEGTRLQVSASNIFGKDEAICTNTGGCQWISPRIVNAEVRYRW